MFVVGYAGLAGVSTVACLVLARRAGNEPPKLVKYRRKQTTQKDWIDDQGRLIDVNGADQGGEKV